MAVGTWGMAVGIGAGAVAHRVGLEGAGGRWETAGVWNERRPVGPQLPSTAHGPFTSLSFTFTESGDLRTPKSPSPSLSTAQSRMPGLPAPQTGLPGQSLQAQTVLADHRLSDEQTTAPLRVHAPHQQRAQEARRCTMVTSET